LLLTRSVVASSSGSPKANLLAASVVLSWRMLMLLKLKLEMMDWNNWRVQWQS
jgi:hypothetical protein